MAKKILIIGGVAGGATAATRLRRLNEDDEIILFDKGEYISFANCGLPYYIGGTIKERDSLMVQTVEGMEKQYGLDVRNFSDVTKIDPEKNTVTVHNTQSGETYDESFDELIISTGAKPIVPKIKGLADAKNTFTLRNIPDMDQIKKYIADHNVQTATIIGGGFIGLEMMENFKQLGLNVQLVEMSSQVMPNLDFEMAQQLHSQINLHNVNLYLNDGLAEFQNDGKKLILQSGKELETDMTILSIGITPANDLAKDAKIELGFKNAIKVNKQLQTNYPNIYAIGDVIQVNNLVDGSETNIPLAWPANRQGRLVADIINGIPAEYPGTQGTSVAKVFELTAASTGDNEKTLQRQNIPYHVIHIHPNSSAGYYPGASPINLKLLYNDDKQILGAQAVGTKGVEKRIDVISTAMRFGAKVDELSSIELSYAPPYSSAKDPVNMLGYVADNEINHRTKTIEWDQVDRLVDEKATIIDVRNDFELTTGKIPSSKLIPLNQLRDRLNELPKDKTIYVYCQVGLRGYNASRVLANDGFDVVNIDGGFKTYKIAKYEIKNKPFSKNKVKTSSGSSSNNLKTLQVDACGLQCPGPILKVKQHMDKMDDGQKMVVKASDFGFSTDIESWAKNTGNKVLSNDIDGDTVVATVQKGQGASTPVKQDPELAAELALNDGQLHETKEGATMVVFDGDLDKALASLIIATGAAAMGKKVTMFFTFWGLNVLKKNKVKKHGVAKMFDMMLPSGADKLPLSTMNMGGLGSKMIKSVMKKNNVDPLPVMIRKANDLGIKFVACTMSMGLMGVKKEELYSFVEYGGVATYLGDTENSNLNLFI